MAVNDVTVNGSPPKANHYHNNNNYTNNNTSTPQAHAYINNDRQIAVRSSLLSPNEVTFCDVSDDDSSIDTTASVKARRKRLNSTDTDVDSIMSSTSKGQTSRPEIPDGGFGWVVVFASMFTSLIADGISFSFGLLYTEFLVYFGESKSKTAWIGSIFLAVPLLSGPIMSNLVDKYGCRRMTIIGGIISGVGFVLSSLSTTVEMLYWTFGFIGGLGLGIGYVTAVCSVVGWFDKRRTFATGIGASGTGIGTFLYAPFTQYLIETFGWRGTCLILAGTLFNICVCGCLMRDPDWLIYVNNLESRSQSMQTFSNSSVCLDEIKKLLEDGAPKEIVLDTLVTNYNTEANQQIPDPQDGTVSKKYRSLLELPTFLCSPDELDVNTAGNRYGSRRSLRKKTEDDIRLRDEMLALSRQERKSNQIENNHNHLASTETLNASEKISFNDDHRLFSETICENDEDRFANEKANKTWSNDKLNLNNSRLSLQEIKAIEEYEHNFKGNSVDALYENNNILIPQVTLRENDISIVIPTSDQLMRRSASGKRRVRNPLVNGDLRRQNTLRNSNYFRNMRIHRNSIHYRGAMMNTHRYRLRASSCPNIYRNSMTTLAREDEEAWYDSFVDIMKSIFDFSLFLNPKFLYFEISTLLLFIWFIVPYFYLPEHMLAHGYKEDDSAFIISLIGGFNTIGMIGLGYIGDQPWMNVPKTYACCLVLCGISTIAMPLVISSYVALCGVGFIFGITFASSFSFTPIILVQLVNLDDFTCAYGLVLLVQGVGNLVGPPLAGLIFELSGAWDWSFYAAGFFISLAGVFVYITGILQDRDKDDEKTDSIDTDE